LSLGCDGGLSPFASTPRDIRDLLASDGEGLPAERAVAWVEWMADIWTDVGCDLHMRPWMSSYRSSTTTAFVAAALERGGVPVPPASRWTPELSCTGWRATGRG
jgi:hypothetical protein